MKETIKVFFFLSFLFFLNEAWVSNLFGDFTLHLKSPRTGKLFLIMFQSELWRGILSRRLLFHPLGFFSHEELRNREKHQLHILLSGF